MFLSEMMAGRAVSKARKARAEALEVATNNILRRKKEDIEKSDTEMDAAYQRLIDASREEARRNASQYSLRDVIFRLSGDRVEKKTDDRVGSDLMCRTPSNLRAQTKAPEASNGFYAVDGGAFIKADSVWKIEIQNIRDFTIEDAE